MLNKKDSKCCYACFCPFSFGLAFGVVCGLLMALFAWAGAMWGFGTHMIGQYGSIYYGYAPTLVGGVMGFVWGLIEGFIFGFLVAWLYNSILRCCKRCSEACCDISAGKMRK